MIDLKRYAAIGWSKHTQPMNIEAFKTLNFDPQEVMQLKEMDRKELMGLMLFCGVHVFNEVPLVVMEEDEMRMAYLGWRLLRIREKENEVKPKMERGIKWALNFREAVKLLGNR